MVAAGLLFANATNAQSSNSLENRTINDLIASCDGFTNADRTDLTADAYTLADGTTEVIVFQDQCPGPNNPEACRAPIILRATYNYDVNGDLVSSEVYCP